MAAARYHQMIRYIFSLMMFCESMQSPLWFCSSPAAPMLGTVQLTSVGNVEQNGETT